MPWVRSWAVAADTDRVCRAIAGCRQQGRTRSSSRSTGASPAYWLSPYQGLLADYQRPLAHALIDAGADAICGHHPHQLHPVEIYRGKPILYSLGNFIFEGRYFGAWSWSGSRSSPAPFGERLGVRAGAARAERTRLRPRPAAAKWLDVIGDGAGAVAAVRDGDRVSRRSRGLWRLAVTPSAPPRGYPAAIAMGEGCRVRSGRSTGGGLDPVLRAGWNERASHDRIAVDDRRVERAGAGAGGAGERSRSMRRGRRSSKFATLVRSRGRRRSGRRSTT